MVFFEAFVFSLRTGRSRSRSARKLASLRSKSCWESLAQAAKALASSLVFVVAEVGEPEDVTSKQGVSLPRAEDRQNVRVVGCKLVKCSEDEPKVLGMLVVVRDDQLRAIGGNSNELLVVILIVALVGADLAPQMAGQIHLVGTPGQPAVERLDDRGVKTILAVLAIEPAGEPTQFVVQGSG